MARLVGRAHGELVVVELAEHDRAGAHRLAVTVDFVGRREAVENVRAGRGANALGGEQILDAERNAFERPRRAFAQARIALLRSFQRALGRGEDEGVERLVRPLDRADMRARKLLG